MPRTRYVCGALRLVLVVRWIQLCGLGLASRVRIPFLRIAEWAYRICQFRLCERILRVLLCIRVDPIVFYSELSYVRLFSYIMVTAHAH